MPRHSIQDDLAHLSRLNRHQFLFGCVSTRTKIGLSSRITLSQFLERPWKRSLFIENSIFAADIIDWFRPRMMAKNSGTSLNSHSPD